MQPAGFAARGACGPQQFVLEEGAVLHGIVDPRQVLTHHLPCAEVQMTHLGVAHLTLGQANRPPPGRELGVLVGGPELVEDRGIGQLNRVAGPRRGEAPPVQDHQADRRDRRRAGAAIHPAAATMPAKSSGSRLAPPTSAPSTSG